MGILSRLRKKLNVIGPGSESQPIRRERPPTPSFDLEPEPEPESPRGEQDPLEYIAEVVAAHPVVLFMKGSPSQPQCGFSASAAGILASLGQAPHHVDVLIDPDVRDKVKDFSNWPTIPQIYVGGEFLGGSDILTQMNDSGELKELLDGLPAQE